MRTCIISWTSLNFGPIGPPTTELSAIEPLSIIMGMKVSPLFHGCLWGILIMLAGKKNLHKRFLARSYDSVELAALEGIKIDVTSFSWLLLIGCLLTCR